MLSVELATVAILGEDHAPKGTGVLVGSNYILTCAHVVGDALGERERAYSKEKPSEALKICFRVANRPSILTVHVDVWSPAISQSELDGPSGGSLYMQRDLALLVFSEEDGRIPEEVKPCRFWDLNNLQGFIEKAPELLACGFPEAGGDRFSRIDFQYRSASNGNEFLITPIKNFDSDDLAGLSGSPLVCKEHGLVIGIIMEQGSDLNHVVVKPVWHLATFWQGLRCVWHGNDMAEEEKIPPRRLLGMDRVSQKEKIIAAVQAIAQITTPAKNKVVLVVVPGDKANWLSDWVRYVMSEEIQYEVEGIPEGDARLIRVYRGRLSANALFKKTKNELLKELGVKTGGDELGKVRDILNEVATINQDPRPPPAYFIFQIAADDFGNIERQLLNRLIRFWDEVAAGGLEMTQLVFFTIITQKINHQNRIRSLQAFQTQVRNAVVTCNHLTHLEVFPGICKQHSQEWLTLLQQGFEEWNPNKTTVEQIDKVVEDIFSYELNGEIISLEELQAEFHKLNLCQI